jgi:hypothetical protein
MSLVQENLFKLAMKIDPTTKSGKKFCDTTNNGVAIASSTNATPIEITTATAHGRATGDKVSISGHLVNTAANNTAANPAWTITYVSPTKYTLDSSVGNGVGVATGTATPFMVGSIDGARFPRQRLIDIYKEARFVLFNAIYETKTPTEIDDLVYGNILTASVAMSYSAPYNSIAKPTGCIRKISIFDSAATPIEIHILPNTLLPDVKRGLVDSVKVTATNLLAFEIGSNWSIVGNYGTSPAIVTYYGITAWTWETDILPNDTSETFNPSIEAILIEIAEAIADEQSGTDVLALAKLLLNKKG